jgi:threonine synthase
VVLPGGNLGNISAFGKGLREMRELGLIPRLPRLAVIQAEGAAPFYELMRSRDRSRLNAVEHPQTLATAIKIGDPVSWPKAVLEITASNGVVEKVTEQGDCRCQAVIGRCGIGCEPASAATLAGIRKLTSRVIAADSDGGGLTGNVLKDADYIHQYHTGILKAPDGTSILPKFRNPPIVLPNNADEIAAFLGA